ncbi:cysteine hydrolase family protein [Mycobacterium sp. 1465703.0]|uniref:cysteine hydrolase family protein n=1 Tax=Mycobacterium sp. 1465703.0 TaxID=1834078 RepID=UPI003512D403
MRRAGADTVVFTGVATNITVEGTARDAVNFGYRTVLVSDACAAATYEAHAGTLATFALLGDVVSAEQAANA